MDLLEIGRMTILGALILAAAVGVPLVMGYYVLHPVDRLLRGRPWRLQFTLVDFVCLLLQWQMALGFTLSQVPDWDSPYFVLIFGFLAASVLLIWLGGVFSLSRLGVESARRRIAFLSALPAIVAAMMIAAAAFGSVPLYVVRFVRQEWAFDLPVDLESGGQVAAIVAAAAVITFVACWLLRRTMNWVVGGCDARQGNARAAA